MPLEDKNGAGGLSPQNSVLPPSPGAERFLWAFPPHQHCALFFSKDFWVGFPSFWLGRVVTRGNSWPSAAWVSRQAGKVPCFGMEGTGDDSSAPPTPGGHENSNMGSAASPSPPQNK